VKSPSGTKRTSDGQPKPESSAVAILEDPPATQAEEKPKAKRGRKPKPAQPSTQRSSTSSAAAEAAPPAPKARKPKQAASAAAAPPSTPPAPPSARASAAPSTPTPARALARPAAVPRALRPAAAATPAASPQSSDAENRPPASAAQGVRVPLAAVEGRQGGAALPKDGGLAKGVRGAAWEAADLEDVFLGEAVKARAEGALGEGAGLGEVVGWVRGAMGERESAMSVEEWVRWNALRGEEELRRRCEEMVMVFEREGNRAMAVLEGVQCL